MLCGSAQGWHLSVCSRWRALHSGPAIVQLSVFGVVTVLVLLVLYSIVIVLYCIVFMRLQTLRGCIVRSCSLAMMKMLLVWIRSLFEVMQHHQVCKFSFLWIA